MISNLPSLKIGDLEVRIPIIQGGMGVGISLSGLASAIANEGGVGVISTAGIGMLEPDYFTNFQEANKRALRKEIRKAKEMTDGIIGVNIMMALTDHDELSIISMEEGADILFLGAGLPLKYPAILQLGTKTSVATKFCPIISSSRAARIIFTYWAKHYNQVPDAVVVEGPLAGGHLGFKKEHIDDQEYKLENLVIDTLSVIQPFEQQFGKSIPVIAAGGIYTGEDIYRFMQLGVQGVQMATRFVATTECDASLEFKQAYLNCSKEDIVIIDSPVGLPGRAIKNCFIESVNKGEKKPFKCPWKCLQTCDIKTTPYCIALALTNAKLGKLSEGFAFCGANAYRLNDIVSVKKLLDTLICEYATAMK